MGGTVVRDISGCATSELAAVFQQHLPKAFASAREWAATYMPDQDERDIVKIVEEQKYTFTGLGIADKIVMALGLDLHTLTETGALTIVPSTSKGAARKMVYEQIAVDLDDSDEQSEEEIARRVRENVLAIGEVEMQARIQRLLDLRAHHCVETLRGREILERDAERTKERREREALAA